MQSPLLSRAEQPLNANGDTCCSKRILAARNTTTSGCVRVCLTVVTLCVLPFSSHHVSSHHVSSHHVSSHHVSSHHVSSHHVSAFARIRSTVYSDGDSSRGWRRPVHAPCRRPC